MIVALHHALSQLLVAAHESVQAVANHSFRQFAHARQIDVGFHLRMTHHAHGGLRDIHRLVADALQVAIDARNGEQKPQIGSHRSLQSKQALNALVDFDLDFVDRVFLVQDGFRQRLFCVEHGVNGLMDGALREAPHPEQPLLQLFEIVFPVAFHEFSVPSIFIRTGR